MNSADCYDKITERLQRENKQLKEALRKCSPRSQPSGKCKFCNYDEDARHAEDCEYVKLIGGAE